MKAHARVWKAMKSIEKGKTMNEKL